MKLRSVLLGLCGAVALCRPVGASGVGTTSALALPTIALDPAIETHLQLDVAVTPGAETEWTASTSARSSLTSRSGSTLESVRWRPRRWREPDRDRDRERWESHHSSSGLSQIHAGYFDPSGDQESGFLAGFRGGASIDDNIQLGVGIDWTHKTDRQTQVVSRVPIPGGGTTERSIELSRSSSNLFPVLGFIQVSPGNDGDVQPYFGIGAGYEVLFLSAEDFTAQEDFDATYGGWGWQMWGGLAIPLSGKSRITTEIFRNSAEVERDVDDATTGLSYRELVDMDGVGMRFGLSWGF